MSIIIDANGFQRSTYADIIAVYQNAFIKATGNSNLDFSSNTPLGQFVNILAQQTYDQETYAQNIYNIILSFNTSSGVNLDSLGSIINVPRNGGSYTLQYVSVTATKIVNLQGLDGNAQGAGFTVSDGNGNNFILSSSTTISPGTTSLLFQAEQIGAVQVSTNTITTLITILDGVTSCNNPLPPLIVGMNEETDGAYRVRLKQSQAISSTGYLDGMLARLLALPNVAGATVLENYSDVMDSNSIPPHSIWVIMNGGSDVDIANVIFITKTMGCGMKGNISVNVLQDDGRYFVALFDRVNLLPMYISVNLTNNSSTPLNPTTIASAFANNIALGLGQTANSGTLTCTLVSTLASLGISAFASDLKISSDNVTFVDILPTPTVQDQWTVSPSNITINIL